MIAVTSVLKVQVDYVIIASARATHDDVASWEKS